MCADRTKNTPQKKKNEKKNNKKKKKKKKQKQKEKNKKNKKKKKNEKKNNKTDSLFSEFCILHSCTCNEQTQTTAVLMGAMWTHTAMAERSKPLPHPIGAPLPPHAGGGGTGGG